MFKKSILAAILALGCSFGAFADNNEKIALALQNIDRSMAIADATWSKCMKGGDSNLYMADQYDTKSGWTSGASDVWPYTAAIEGHCSLLEALDAAKNVAPDLYAEKFEFYKHRLELLIDNLEYYRGTYRLSSYASSNVEWSPYAVPRANRKGGANVTGILNVYDDQMWIARELIRAYRITDNKNYLDLATYLVDYCIDGWDCWRDENGNEYGGITWGPGYNSKHACSNGPIIQPLVWLHEIYDGTGETVIYNYRDEANSVKHETRQRSEFYLEFAKKVCDWQKAKLAHSSGVYYDMMGAPGEIIVNRGYRQHVDTGGAVGSFYSYNTGTMIAGAASIYKVTGEQRFRDDINLSCKGARTTFSKYIRSLLTYEFTTDATAENGFSTWFNDVLLRGCIDALPYCDNNMATTTADSFQKNLDYAFENHNRNNMLPIHFIDGWGEETKTKGFFQFTFMSEYGVLATRLLHEAGEDRVEAVTVDAPKHDDMVYSITGALLGRYDDMKDRLHRGIYIVKGKKFVIK